MRFATPGARLDRRTLLRGAAALSVSGVLAGCGNEGNRTLRAVDAQPAGYPTVRAVEHMAGLLEQRTNGRLRVKMYSGGQLGAEKDTLEITIFGGLDFNRVNTAPLNSIVPETVVPALPFMFRSIDHMRRSMDGRPGRMLLKSLEPHGLIGLCFYDSGARSFYTSKRLIESPDEMRGLKIRVQNSDLYVSLVEALGGDATPMAFSEVYQGLLQGVVDGAENNWPSYESTRHFEVAPHYSLTRHVMAPEVLVMSAKRWEKLEASDQELIRQCARESVPVMREIWDARVEASRKIVMQSGIELAEPDIAPFQAAVVDVWSRYLVSGTQIDIADEVAALARV